MMNTTMEKATTTQQPHADWSRMTLAEAMRTPEYANEMKLAFSHFDNMLKEQPKHPYNGIKMKGKANLNDFLRIYNQKGKGRANGLTKRESQFVKAACEGVFRATMNRMIAANEELKAEWKRRMEARGVTFQQEDKPAE